MATFSQWRTAIDAGDLRRVTFVAGDQPVLIEEVIDTTREKLAVGDLDYVSLSHTSTFDRDVWAQANQYSLTPGVNRLVLIRDAEKITRWQPLHQWLTRTRAMPGVYLLFVSGEPDLPHITVAGRKVLKEYVAQLKAPRGFVVRCSTPPEADAIGWLRRRCRLDDSAARHLLTRTGGNLAAAAAVCAKLTLFPQTAGPAAIDALVTETPAADFSDSLIALDRRKALLAAQSLRHEEAFKVIALLDSRLDLLARLHRIQAAGQSWRDVSGVSPYLQRLYLPHARHYDSGACLRRRRVLALADDALRSAARVGVLETLVALW